MEEYVLMGIRRLVKPSRKTAIVAALILGIVLSAYGLGATFDDREEMEIFALRGQATEVSVPGTGRTETIKTSADAASAAAVASDSAKTAASGLSIWSLASWARTEAGGEEVVLESVEEFAERMVVFTARLGLRVDDVDSVVNDIRGLTEDFGGFVAGVSTSREGGGFITIRVPQGKFYEVIVVIEGLGEVEERDLRGEDVTEDYVDLGAQLRNLQRQEERFVEILDMCVKVEEVLKVEAELKRARGEIERITGEMKYLESRVELATITVYLNEEFEEKKALFPEVDWGAPVNAGLQALFTVFQGLLAITILLGPFAAIGVPAYYLYRRGNKGKDASRVEA
jgi:hypothetical protein